MLCIRMISKGDKTNHFSRTSLFMYSSIIMEITKFSAVTSKDVIDQIREDVRTHRVVVFRDQGLYVR